jgi:hypothetical protein
MGVAKPSQFDRRGRRSCIERCLQELVMNRLNRPMNGRVSRLAFRAEVLGRIAAAMPWPVLRRLVARQTRGMSLAFCLHRVGHERRPYEVEPALTVPETVLDEFVEQMCHARREHHGGACLTLAFDDGYADAVEYVAARAPRYPQVEWLLFVCPSKIHRGVGFRWDAYEAHLEQGRSVPSMRSFIQPPDADYRAEHEREDLAEVAKQDRFALATHEQLLEVAALPNVALGNHSNSHLICALPLHQALRDLDESTHMFEEMFGPCRQFAFPFGVPELHFQREHVEHLRRLRPLVMWTTESYPYRAEQRRSGAVLPRFVFNGLWSAQAMALWVALRARRIDRAHRAGWVESAGSPAALAVAGSDLIGVLERIAVCL